MAAERRDLQARQARDVMAFGQEFGRALSDGRIVGRAEPFAKVFPSSRAVKRAVGLAAWGVLEDIALDARLDEDGRLVARTSVRRIADNLGLNKETVSRHLARLREFGFVELLRFREGSGRWESCCYELKPSACVERFTHTPTANEPAGQAPRPENPDTDKPDSPPPCTDSPEPGCSGTRTTRTQQQDVVADSRQRQQQDRAPDDALRAGLVRLGVARAVAAELVACQPPDRVRQALEAAAAESVRNPAAWVVGALRDGWDFASRLAHHREAVARDQHQARQAAAQQADAEAERQRAARAAGWCAAVSAALDDASLTQAVAQITTPAPGLARRSVPLARAQLLAWAVATHRRHHDVALSDALTGALADGLADPFECELDDELPDPPPPEAEAEDLAARIARCLPGHHLVTRPL